MGLSIRFAFWLIQDFCYCTAQSLPVNSLLPVRYVRATHFYFQDGCVQLFSLSLSCAILSFSVCQVLNTY